MLFRGSIVVDRFYRLMSLGTNAMDLRQTNELQPADQTNALNLYLAAQDVDFRTVCSTGVHDIKDLDSHVKKFDQSDTSRDKTKGFCHCPFKSSSVAAQHIQHRISLSLPRRSLKKHRLRSCRSTERWDEVPRRRELSFGLRLWFAGAYRYLDLADELFYRTCPRILSFIRWSRNGW